MKAIPYKCKFGHVTIRNYNSEQLKPSVTICEECLKLSGEPIYKDHKSNVKGDEVYSKRVVGIARENEIAYRY